MENFLILKPSLIEFNYINIKLNFLFQRLYYIKSFWELATELVWWSWKNGEQTRWMSGHPKLKVSSTTFYPNIVDFLKLRC